MPTTDSSIDRLRDVFATSSDVELHELHSAGAEAYTASAWQRLDEEFARRGFANDGRVPVEESPPPC